MLFRYNYGCKKFTWWLNRFHNVFEEQGLIVHKQHHIRHSASGLCVEAMVVGHVKIAKCDPDNAWQRWGFIVGGVGGRARIAPIVSNGGDVCEPAPFFPRDSRFRILYIFSVVNTPSPRPSRPPSPGCWVSVISSYCNFSLSSLPRGVVMLLHFSDSSTQIASSRTGSASCPRS